MKQLLEKIDFQVSCADYAELDRSWNSGLFGPASRYVPWTRIYFPLSGEGRVECDGKETVIERGKLILIPPCAKVHVSCRDFLNKYWIHFSAQIAGHDLFSLFDEVVSRPLDESNFSFTEKLFFILHRQYRPFKNAGNGENPFEEQSAQAALMLLVEPFLIKMVKFAEEPDFFRILDVMSYLNNNLHRHITLTELGQYTNMHPNYFSALFKKQAGVPPITYLNILRLNRALRELERGNLRINEISELIGAANPAAFSKMIRKATGVSPREYRQAAEKGTFLKQTASPEPPLPDGQYRK